MAARFPLVIDCTDPDLLAHFWAAALGYELGPGADCIIDPEGGGPRIWFQVVAETKTVKNRLHLDVHASGGRGTPVV